MCDFNLFQQQLSFDESNWLFEQQAQRDYDELVRSSEVAAETARRMLKNSSSVSSKDDEDIKPDKWDEINSYIKKIRAEIEADKEKMASL